MRLTARMGHKNELQKFHGERALATVALFMDLALKRCLPLRLAFKWKLSGEVAPNRNPSLRHGTFGRRQASGGLGA